MKRNCDECFGPFDGSSVRCIGCQEARDELLTCQEEDILLELDVLEISDAVIACRAYSIEARDTGRDATARSYWLLAMKLEDFVERHVTAMMSD